MARYFFSELNPPRPSFMQDMTAGEKRLMGEHVVYWRNLAEKGVALLFGPVADPKGGYGIYVTRVENEEEIAVITANDPMSKSGSLSPLRPIRCRTSSDVVRNPHENLTERDKSAKIIAHNTGSIRSAAH